MALMHVNFFSEVLGLCCQMDVILPQKSQGIGVQGKVREGKYPVLWLLHGRSDDNTIWQRRTSIERYVASLGLAVVMPAVQLSYYTNMAYGGRYFDFVAEELPKIAREFFPISEKREDNFIAGLSMGGYGAMKIGLSKPENYSAIGCLSGGNAPYRYSNDSRGGKPIDSDTVFQVFGVKDIKELRGTKHDLFTLADKAIDDKKILPRIFFACGTEDPRYEDTKFTYEWFARKGFECTYGEGPGGHHWDVWDEWIQKYLDWLNL